MKRCFMLVGALLVVAGGARGAEPAAESAEFSGVLLVRDRVELRPRVTATVERVHVKPGDMVKRGDLLFTLDGRLLKAELARAEADLKVGRAELDLATLILDRARLLPKPAFGKEENDGLVTKRDLADAQVTAAHAAINMAKLKLEFTRITAPIDGVLDPFGQVTVGSLVTADKTVLTGLSSLDPILIDFSLDEPTLLRLQKLLGNKSITRAKLAVKVGLAADKELSLAGTLDAVDTALDPKSRLLRARASMPNPGGKLVAGQLVKLRIVFPEAKPEK